LLEQIKKTLFSAKNDNLPSSESLKKSHTDFCAKIDPLEKLVDRSSGDLYENTLKLIGDFRRLISISRRLSSNPLDYKELNKSADELLISLEKNCNSLQQKAQETIAITQ